MKTIRFSVLALLMALVQNSAAWSFLIDNVTVVPSIPTTATPISLEVAMTTPSSPPSLFAPTTTSMSGNHFDVNVFVDLGPLPALGSLIESVPLGALPVGAYSYTVTLNPVEDVPFGRDMRVVNGSFEVVPEPASLVMAVGAALLALRFRQRAVAPTGSS